MERETLKVKLPISKNEVTLKSWLTGGEKLEMLKVEQAEQINWLLKTLVVAPENLNINEMHGKDFDYLLLEMNKVADNSSWKEEKKA